MLPNLLRYSHFRGVIVLVRIFDGQIKAGDHGELFSESFSLFLKRLET